MSTEHQIHLHRLSVSTAIENGTDATQHATVLLNINSSLTAKFRVIDFCHLLSVNSQSPNSLKKLLNALNILEKYGRHLLKPAESRSNMWRHIKYSNAIFRDRVDVINGGRDIMYVMGYTESKEDGVAFPDTVEPDHSHVLNLVTDIFYGRKELEAFLEKQHPYPANIEAYISPELRQMLRNDQARATNQTTANRVSHHPTPTSTSSPRQPVIGADENRNFPVANLPHNTANRNYSPITSPGENYQPMSGNPLSSASSHYQPLPNVSQSGMPGNYQTLPNISQQNTTGRNFQPVSNPAGVSYQPMSNISHSASGQNINMSNVGQTSPGGNYPPMPNMPHVSSGGNYQPLSQLPPRTISSAQHYTPGNVQYTSPQQKMYEGQGHMESQSVGQGHMDRQSVPETRDRNVAQVSSPDRESQDPNAVGIVCDICGDNDADVICTVCDNKQLCKGCDLKWHNHPKRQNHKLTQLRAPSVSAPSTSVEHQQSPRPEGKPKMSLITQNTSFDKDQYMQMNDRLSQGSHHSPSYQQNSPRTQVRDQDETQVLPMYNMMGHQQYSPHTNTMPRYNLPNSPILNQPITMSPGSAGSPVSERNRPQYQYDPRTSHYNSVSQGPPRLNIQTAGMSEPMTAHMTGDYIYSQPNMVGHMPNVMQYHGSMMPSGQPMAYGVYPGHMPQQYPVSYQTYMPSSQQQQQHQQQMSLHHERISRSDLPRPETMSSNSPHTLPRPTRSPDVAVNRLTMTSPNIDEFSKEALSFLSESSSELLPNIRMIPDLEKRQARLEIHLMTLNDDLKDWEKRINEIILQIPNFFQDEEYMTLNRKKRKHLQEKQVLESYQRDLQEAIDSNNEEKRQKQEEYEQALEVENLRKRSHQLRTNANEQLSTFPFGSHSSNHPHSPQTSERVNSNQSGAASSGPLPVGPVTTTYRRPDQGQNQAKVNIVDDVNCPSLQLNSLGDDDDLPAELRQKLSIAENSPGVSKSSLGTSITGSVVFPPDMSGDRDKSPSGRDSQLRKEKSEPNFQGDESKQRETLRKSQSSSAVQKWQCSHCTYMNPSDTKVCFMCSKTSDNPKIIQPDIPPLPEELPAQEACEVCTYDNERGTKVCEMCGHTQKRYAELEAETMSASASGSELDMNVPYETKKDLNQKTKKQDTVGAGAGGMEATDNTGVGSAGVGTESPRNLIEMEQDQVYMEKKAAREKFERMNQMNAEQVKQGVPVDLEQVIPAINAECTDVKPKRKQSDVVKPGIVESSKPEQTISGDKLVGRKSPSNKNVDKLKNDSNDSSGSYSSAVSDLCVSPKDDLKVKVNDEGQKKGQGQPPLNLAETIEQINLKKEQVQMSLDGHNFMSELKEAEHNGFEIPEFEIALQHCLEDNLSPLEWLKQKWSDNIDVVVTMATNRGKEADRNDVGDISHQEAKDALIECKGNIEQAADMCVNDRKKKYAEISEGSRYPREEILTALYQRCGDIEDVIDQLNQAVVQRFKDRIWEPTDNEGGDAAISAAVRMSVLGNSVSNSIINNEEFKKIISDMNIDRERRVRMVLIEAKLKSWGRAETVITILDNEITNSDAPLECDIEDIIEAARNCGDRKSSLIYLRQECTICFSLYPMSKIRNLGVCDCKLCISCLQTYFEVAVREHFVRNWGCPNCEAPGLEDEVKASQYFEFLSLLLQNLVSKELLDLYETKLRDWHLQKEPNFRWCAHCACGFLYDRPGVLGMECPSCHEKTCFKCKKKWEPQHEGFTCEEYERWKIDNDPEKQAKGVKLYLEENGIDCPSCKMRYSLAKGGCMHFKCPQCGYEFCSGCNQAFLHQGACKLLKSCNRGLHCHHPRDCFYYLRDYDIQELQRLLKNHKVMFNTTVPATQQDKQHCQVMEQKEFGTQKKDEACGKDTGDGMAGLCELHYKEYLVSLINKNKVDPISIANLQKMKLLIERNEKHPPKVHHNEGEKEYCRRLMQFIQEKWPIQR